MNGLGFLFAERVGSQTGRKAGLVNLPRARRNAVAAYPLRLFCITLLMLVCVPFVAQSQLLSEENLRDGVLGRKEFEVVERNALDLNRDGVLDVADLTFFLYGNSGRVPSVSFGQHVIKACEGDMGVLVPIVFTKTFESPATLTYSLGGTATLGAKDAGGDFLIAGYDSGTGVGTIHVNAGDSEASIQITLYDDGLLENSETISLTLTGGGLDSYFLGSPQTVNIYFDDNDGVWTTVLDLPDGPGYSSFEIEMVQEEGQFSARVLADTGLIPAPETNDPNASGEDGWGASVYASANAMRIEAGPIPIASTLSVFAIPYSRYFILEVKPGLTNYVFEPQRRFSGAATQILEPTRGRLGPAWEERSYLRREASGIFSMEKHLSAVVMEEVPLADAK